MARQTILKTGTYGLGKFPREALTQALLREILIYEPETGIWRWRPRIDARGRSSLKANRIAGAPHKDGYRRVRLGGNAFLLHRLAFLYMTGKMPEGDVDHRDNDRSNDRWENLREATRAQNLWNMKRTDKNTSGFKNVSWHAGARKWMGMFKHNYQSQYVGLFDDPAVAHAAVIAQAQKIRGEFHRDG